MCATSQHRRRHEIWVNTREYAVTIVLSSSSNSTSGRVGWVGGSVYAHGKHVEVGRLGLGELDAGDAQRPDIDARPIVLLQYQLGRLEGQREAQSVRSEDREIETYMYGACTYYDATRKHKTFFIYG